MLHQVGVSFDLYYDARKHKIKKKQGTQFLILTHFDLCRVIRFAKTIVCVTDEYKDQKGEKPCSNDSWCSGRDSEQLTSRRNVRDVTIRTNFLQWCTLEFCSGRVQHNSVEDRRQRKKGSGGGSPLFRGSGGNCNLVQEISFHIVKFS